MTKARVSVIVPCFMQAAYLAEALDSVLAQSYPYWECIVINDGSPDNTEMVAIEYCKKDSRFRYLSKENGGHSSARNLGIKASSGKYILPLDGDDKITAVYLEKAVEALENNEEVKLVLGQAAFFGTINEKWQLPKYDLRSLLIMNCFYISSVFRRGDFDKTKGFDETMVGYEDWDFFISLLKNGGEVIHIPELCFYYRIKDISTFQDFKKNKPRLFADALKLYNNQADVYERYFDSPLVLIQENEKLNRIVSAYHQSRTYKWGTKIHRLLSLLKGTPK